MKKSIPIEIIIASLSGFTAIWLFERLRLENGFWEEIGILGTPIFLIYSPFLFSKIFCANPDRFGITFKDASNAIRFALKIALWVLPIFGVGYFIYEGIIFQKEINFGYDKPIISVLIWNLVGISFPEEVFFRGYLQTRLRELVPGKIKLYKTDLSWAALLGSILFAVAHLLTAFEPSRLIVFFPSCLFGWIRDRTNSILGPAVFHWLCNCTLFLLAGFY